MLPIHVLALGADPEVFLVDEQGKPFSAEGIFGGTKHNPKPMKGLPEGYFIQEDNVAAEYNVPPSEDIKVWAASLQKGLSYVRKVARRRKLAPYLAPDFDFPVHQVITPHAMELGCDPDFNAWTQSKNPRPKPPPTMRTAAAHVHISWVDPTDDQRWELVKALDLNVGVPSILFTPPNRRRKLYGRAGACRLKPYGVEYRVLDNFYLHSIALSMQVGHRIKTTAEMISRYPMLREAINKRGEEIQKCINEHDQTLAQELMDTFNLERFF
jgi:hypothetical protein